MYCFCRWDYYFVWSVRMQVCFERHGSLLLWRWQCACRCLGRSLPSELVQTTHNVGLTAFECRGERVMRAGSGAVVARAAIGGGDLVGVAIACGLAAEIRLTRQCTKGIFARPMRITNGATGKVRHVLRAPGCVIELSERRVGAIVVLGVVFL